ncbi:MAG TPA: nuclear transport factor 2 family protein [Verrucomicrobiae bacterium]|nr:nuclear transport factor 2 family protein [Verrucomicrobiae bacterium]
MWVRLPPPAPFLLQSIFGIRDSLTVPRSCVRKNPSDGRGFAVADSSPGRGCIMKITRIAALVAFLALPFLAHGQASMGKTDKAAQEVIEFRNRYIEAEENRDMAFLDKILADDFFALNPQGKLLDKAGQLENLKRPDRTLKVLNPRETHVQFYANGQVAILTEHVTVDGMDKGKPFGGEYRFLRVFAKQNGNWKVVLAQGAPMPEQSAGAK